MVDTSERDRLADFGWDADNRRFRAPEDCPYPDCGQPVDPTNTLSASALAWCPSCQRPYEAIRIPGAAPYEIYRHPYSAYSTHTGELLTGASLLSWGEAGGHGGRTNSFDDSLGAIFGAPSIRLRISLRDAWEQPSLMGAADPEDYVRTVSVVCGKVVAVTARGRIGVFDAITGEKSPQRHLDWPDGSTDPGNLSRAVVHAPAFRGTRMVLAAAHQALFRDLRLLLFGGKSEVRYRLVDAGPGVAFLGPPLMIDTADGNSLCCLLAGRAGEGAILQARLRFFTLGGEEVRELPIEDVVRPPVFVRKTGHLVWVDRKGSVFWLAADQIANGASVPEQSPLPSSLLQLEPDDRPSLIAAPHSGRGTELWIPNQEAGQVILYKCFFEDVQQKNGQSWAWETRSLGRLGPLSGIAVGIGSSRGNDAAGQLLAVSTMEKVGLFQRYSNINSTHPMQGLEIGGSRGSYDPPVVCSAGVVARLQGMLALDNQGIGWDDSVLHPHVAIPGIYDRPQGIAMFGPRIFIGHGLGVRGYLLLKEASVA